MTREAALILAAEGLGKTWRGQSRAAVDDVSIALAPGQTLALVGESGSGKSTLARLLLRLAEPDAGRVMFAGRDITRARGGALRDLRRRTGLVLQDPLGSLDPRLSVAASIAEPLLVHGIGDAAARRARVAELFAMVALDPALGARLPAALSGGQRQRVGIARALALDPALLVLDEPVAALDVSVQAQIVNLLGALQARTGVAMLLITHDLAIVRQMADRVAVMQEGRIVEAGEAGQVLDAPRAELTQRLLAASPCPPAEAGRSGLWRDALGRLA